LNEINFTQRGWRHIPRSVWALGLVSLFMDISSEMVHSLLPVFMVTILGAGVTSVGVIEGIAEATALIIRIYSGVLSDRIGNRKIPALIGYALGALSKPLFAVASGLYLVFAARFIDRIGKGIRGAPRDALIADVTPANLRGAAYGLRQSLDTLGAFLGPLLAVMLMSLTAGNYRAVFTIAFIPGLFSVVILALFVRERASSREFALQQTVFNVEIGSLGRNFWTVTGCGFIFTLARFSEAFLLLRAYHVGIAIHRIPLFLVLMNTVFSLTAYPAGFISDRIGRTGLLKLGLGALLLSNLVLAGAETGRQVAAGVFLWGLHMGLTQGVLSALVADSAPGALRGSAFGIFHMVSGIALLAASIIAGLLWDCLGAPATFYAGAIFAGIALAGFWVFRPTGTRAHSK